jgi:hypothetical protein
MADIFDTISYKREDIFDTIGSGVATEPMPTRDIFDEISDTSSNYATPTTNYSEPVAVPETPQPIQVPQEVQQAQSTQQSQYGGYYTPEDYQEEVDFRQLEKASKGKLSGWWSEFFDATARGMANIGSAYYTVTGRPEKAKLYHTLASHPEIMPQDEGLMNKALNVIGETLPYITATSAATIIAGPAGTAAAIGAGGAVGGLVEGNSAYQTAIDSGVDVKKATMIGVGVGVINGAIEAVGGKMAGKLANVAIAKLNSKVARGITKFTANTIIEALEEGSQEIASLTGESTYRDINWTEITSRTLGSMAGGAFLGGLMGSARTAGQAVLGQQQTDIAQPQIQPEQQMSLQDIPLQTEESIKQGVYSGQLTPEEGISALENLRQTQSQEIAQSTVGLSQETIEPTHTMPDGTVMAGAEHQQETVEAPSEATGVATVDEVVKTPAVVPPKTTATPKAEGEVKAPHEMTTKEFIKDTEVGSRVSKVDEPSPNQYKDGDLMIDTFGEDPYIYELQHIDPRGVDFNLEGMTREQVINMPTTQKYIEWAKQGIEPPPITVVNNVVSGNFKASNRRRMIAAQEAGTKVPAFVEIGRRKEMIKKALADGLPVPAEVLAEYPNLAPTSQTATPKEEGTETKADGVDIKTVEVEKQTEIPAIEKIRQRLYAGEITQKEAVKLADLVKRNAKGDTIGATVGETVTPNLYIGNVTTRMKEVFADQWNKLPDDVKGFTEEGFPTKRTSTAMSRGDAVSYLGFLTTDLQSRLDNNKIKTENDLARANADWGDISALRESLKLTDEPAPFKVVRGKGQQMIIEKDTKSRIWMAIKGIDKPVTTKDALKAVMRGMVKAAKGGYVQGARDSMVKFRLATKLTEANRQDALDIVKLFVPKELQGRYIKRIVNAKTDKRTDQLADAIDLYITKAERKQTVSDFRKFIKDVKSNYRQGSTPLGKLRNDVRTKLLDVLNKYDITKLSEGKKEQLESRQEYISNVAGSVADAFESLEESGKDILQMPNARIKELNRLRKTHIESLSSDEIRYIQSSLDHLIKTAEKKGQVKERTRSEKVGGLVTRARGEVHSKTKDYGVIEETQGLLGFGKRVLSTAQATPRTLIGLITGKNNSATTELVSNNLKNSLKEKHRILKDFVLSYKKMMAKAGITAKDTDMLSEKTTITYGGKTFETNIDTVLSLYMDTQAEGNLSAILKVGRVFDIHKRDAKHLYIKSKSRIHTSKPSLSEIRDIIDFVEKKNPVLKKIADVYFEHNYEVQSPEINKTSMAYQNYELARKKKYWHMSRVMPKNVEGKRTDISVSVESQGRFLPITGGNQPLRVTPFTQELISNMQVNASYAATTMPMQDIKALIGNKQWQDKVIKSGNEQQLKALITMIRRIQGQITDQDFIDLAGSKVLNNFGKAALSLRISGYAVQTASIPAAFETIEPKYFLGIKNIANLPRIPIKAVKEMMEQSPTLWVRWTARQFDYVVGGAAAQDSFNNLMWSEESLSNKALNHYVWGDQKAIYQIHLASQRKVSAETKLKKGTAEFNKKAMEITEEALDSQPQWDMMHRNELTSSPNVFLRGSLMFQSARNAQYNVLLRAMDDYRKGRISAIEASKRTSGVMYANILVAVVKRLAKMGIKYGALGLIYLATDDDDKKEKIAEAVPSAAKKDATQVPIDSVLNLIGLPAFGGIASNIAYEVVQRLRRPGMRLSRLQDIRTGNVFSDLSLDATGVVSDTSAMMYHMLTKEKFKGGKDKDKPKWGRDAKEVADGLAELIAIRYGLPYSALKGEVFYQVKSAQGVVKRAVKDKTNRPTRPTNRPKRPERPE